MAFTQLMSDQSSGAEVSSLKSLLQLVENERLTTDATWLLEPARDEITTRHTITPRSERFLCK